MADDQRPYRPISVEMIGVESGLQRFTKDGATSMPPVARWRNNLTAMSQYENLHFCANGHCIAVYQPEFPYQKLGRHPALLIKPELANPRAVGLLNRHRSGADEHCINHLIIGQLGSQEILLLATDSGNVEAYYTTSILNAIEQAQRTGLIGNFADTFGLRPFFKHWVFQSAWGLSIHKEARMIAVSSNVPSHRQWRLDRGFEESTATITVFAFALSQTSIDTANDLDGHEDGYEDEDRGESEDEDEDDHEDADGEMLGADWTTWDKSQDSERPRRGQNYKVLLKGDDGHVTNIPNISFVNTPEDIDGVWLLSTDITGIMKLWQVWKGTCVRQWDFSNEDTGAGPWIQASYPGWNVAALDMEIFRPVKTNAEFIGADKAPIHYGYHDKGPSFNVTGITNRIPGNSHSLPLQSDPSDPGVSNDTTMTFNNLTFEDDDFDLNDEDAMDTSQQIPSTSSQEIGVQDSQAESHMMRNTEHSLEFEFEQEIDENDTFSDVEDDSEEEEEPATPPPPANRQIARLRAKVQPYQFPNVSVPKIAMIHCSNTHIRMLGSPKARYPHIFCANVVTQSIPEDIANIQPGAELQFMNRLNMIHSISELGILIIATQAGRVAVCSLTRKDNLFGFRVDWILPTKQQEQSGRRPFLHTLLGMAVAPIQRRETWSVESISEDETIELKDGLIDGVKTTFDPNVVVLSDVPTSKERQAQRAGHFPEPKLEQRPWKQATKQVSPWQAIEHYPRYRLMLTYTDLSILTYEITRTMEQSSEAD